jgi:hypothetical protein
MGYMSQIQESVHRRFQTFGEGHRSVPANWVARLTVAPAFAHRPAACKA